MITISTYPGPMAGLSSEELLIQVYAELRRLAADKMTREAEGHTLQATALVHEAWLRLEKQRQREFNGRTAFFRAAAETMRRVLIDRARAKLAQKRGAREVQMVDIAEFESLELKAPDDEIVAVNDALEELAVNDPVSAELVKLRYFVGMTMNEAAEVLEMPVRSAERRWAFCRAWLRKAIKPLP
jgi:RNA polymerase sigma factor (TIGR02999 family)